MNPTQILFFLGLNTFQVTIVVSSSNPPLSHPPSIHKDSTPHIPLDLERSHFFHELLSWYELVPVGWIQRKSTLYESILKGSLSDDPVLLAYFLDPENNRKHFPIPLQGQNDIKGQGDQERPRPTQWSELPTTAQRPELPTTAQLPELPTTAQLPELPTTAQRPELPTTAQLPEMPTTAQRPEHPARSTLPSHEVSDTTTHAAATTTATATPTATSTATPAEVPASNNSYYPLPFCSSSLGRQRSKVQNQKPKLQNHAKGKWQNPFGCRLVLDPPSKRYLVCDSTELSIMPRIPANSTFDLFELTDTRVKEVPEWAFWNTSVKSIRINGNVIETVDPRAFFGSSNTTLVQMMHNKLNWIWFEGAFEGLDKIITLQLDFNGISLENFDKICAEKRVEDIKETLQSLRTLSLRHNPLKIIPKTLFAPFRSSKVSFLVLDNCELTDIHPEALTFFPRLTKLELGENPKLMQNLNNLYLPLQAFKEKSGKLTNLGLANNGLHTTPFPVLQLFENSLVTLDLQKNTFGSLSGNSFPPNMLKLKNLNLAASNLRTIKEGAFDGMPNLEVLMLNENHFVKIPPPIGTLNRLMTLDLSDNIVEDHFGYLSMEIPDNIFEKMEKLSILMFTNSRMKELRAEQLKGLVRLRLLYLNECRLEKIHDFTFMSTPALITLNLSGNRNLRPPNSNTFYGLAALETLYMNSTQFMINQNQPMTIWKDEGPYGGGPDFVTISGAALGNGRVDSSSSFSRALRPFRYLNRLGSLYLYDNRLSFLHSRLFSDLPLLKTLVLTDNKIEEWKDPIFFNNTQLENIFLDKNQLRTTTPAMIADFSQKPVWPALGSKVIDLRENPFHYCDRGICALKLGMDQGHFDLVGWTEKDAYQCLSLVSDASKINIPDLSDEFCKGLQPALPTPPPNGPNVPTQETTTTNADPNKDADDQTTKGQPATSIKKTIMILMGSLCGFLLLMAIVYLKRTQIHILWFGLKLNMERQMGKVKSEGQVNHFYDYDVFISYSHLDSEFIQKLVPELEGTGKLLGEGSGGMNFDLDAQSTCSSTVSLGLGVGSVVNDAFRVCLHLRDFQVGAPITENIIECVDRSRKVLAVVSNNYLDSQWCLFEMNLAYHRLVEGRRSSIVLVLLDNVSVKRRTKVLSHLMRSRTYLQWPSASANKLEVQLFWKRLKAALSSDTESFC